MAYKEGALFKLAKAAIVDHKLLFIEDIVSYLPCNKSTFYAHIRPDSNEYNELKELIDNNRVAIKCGLRRKWYNSDNPTVQIALYRLTATDQERRRLNQQYMEVTGADGAPLHNEPLVIEVIDSRDKVGNEDTDE